MGNNQTQSEMDHTQNMKPLEKTSDNIEFEEEEFKLVRTKTRMFYPTDRFMAQLYEKRDKVTTD